MNLKALLTMAMVLSAASAPAQEQREPTSAAFAQQEVTDRAATWEKVWDYLGLSMAVPSDHPSSPGYQFRYFSGVSREGQEKLRRYMGQVSAAETALAVESYRSTCANKATLVASREALAQKVESDEAKERAFHRAVVDNLSMVLGAFDEWDLRAWIDRQPTNDPTPGTADQIRSGSFDLDDWVSAACFRFEQLKHVRLSQ